ncbi:hypothetical protein [Streptomyces sp. NPDC014676]|uniref:hypothetical protein n=1 Tax=Streptomyces sp. NPDC014676 TaxID=3364879 RepID=UPI0037018D72
MFRTNRCTAAVTLTAAAVLTTLAWAVPAQAADGAGRGPVAAPQDFTWTPPAEPIGGGRPYLPGAPGDFTWGPAHPDDFTWTPPVTP